MVLVRDATEADLPVFAAIYDDEVRHSISTFATEPPGVEHWQARLARTRPGDHLLAAEVDGVTVGTASSGDYRPRAAYLHTRELSINLAPHARGAGVGRALYDELLGRLRADGMRLAVGVIALPNDGSEGLHRACGFDRVGVLHDVGRKFDRWIDTAIWELRLSGGR